MLKNYKEDKIYEMNHLNSLFALVSPSELLFRTESGFSIGDNYFIVGSTGDIKSFQTYQEAENYMKTASDNYRNHLNNILDQLLDEEEPGVIIDYDSCHLLEAGDRDALVYSLQKYRGQKATIVKLPNDRTFIKGLLRNPNLLRDFHQLTMDMFD